MTNTLQNIRAKGSASQRASAAFVCALLAFVLAFVVAPNFAWAEPEAAESSTASGAIVTADNEVRVQAKVTSYSSTTLSAAVTYDNDFESEKPTKFTYHVSGNTKPYLLYKLNALSIETSNGWEPVVDSTRGKFGEGYSDLDYFEDTFYTPGNYKLSFLVMPYSVNSDGTKSFDSYVRFEIPFTVPATADMKSVETIVAEVADQCKKECAAKGDTSQYAYALWLNDWLVDNTDYDNSLMYCSAESALNRHLATCEGYHEAYVKLLNKVGIETRRVDSQGDFHVWTGAKLDGTWYNIDTTWNDSSSSNQQGLDLKRLYFALPTSVMEKVHTKWDGNYAVGFQNRAAFDADAYADNYFIKSGEITQFAKPYLEDTSGVYSVKAKLAAKETSFELPPVNASWPDNYKNVVYALVAHQIQEHDWDNNVKVAAAYDNNAITCQAAYSLEGAEVSAIEAVTFNGKAFEPKPTVTLDGKRLVADTDYKLTYSNNIEASTASKPAVVTITGMGDYSGTITKTFTIKQLDLSLVAIDGLAYPWSQKTYTGSAITPTPAVRTGDGVLPTNDYTYVYSNNINVGKATITIMPTNANCTGSKSSTFDIVAQSIDKVTISAPAVTYNGKAQRPVVVKDGSRTLKEGTDYTITYSNNVNVGTAQATIKGINNYNGSKTVSFAINQASSSSSSSGGSSSGGAATPPAASSPSGSNSAVVPTQPTPVTTQAQPSAKPVTGTWKKSGGKWWFAYDAKTQAAQSKPWPKNEWVVISGKRYYFDGSGYMKTKWLQSGGKWYWLGTDGAMKTGWIKSGSKWYYLASDGIMQTGKKTISGQTYYLNTSNGAMKTGWNKEGSGWYYYKSSGVMAKGWAKVGSKWYYLDPSNGLMRTGFYKVGNTWYYSNGSGAMLTKWQKISGKYYYFNGSGAMQYNKWIGNYYVGSDGVMATNTWIGKYHVNASGKWDRTR
ncbi:transglutaminase domain-containing protein [Anaerotardibacter muris]|uniref:transglutaminase domain-containing protein n=1 Tax=Anaerotardibacter muris TaxID=2941505 RepID=UPI0020417738|nr:transglutaminase domain-containing protein [Anaerotardibacter muris]